MRPATILNSTLVGNDGRGGAGYAPVTLQNTVLAENGGNDCWTAVTR